MTFYECVFPILASIETLSITFVLIPSRYSSLVLLVRVLSCLYLNHISQVIAIDVNDPLAKDLNDISDVEEQLPGYVSGIREWFRWYKTPDDKPLNGFGFAEKALDKVQHHKVASLVLGFA